MGGAIPGVLTIAITVIGTVEIIIIYKLQIQGAHSQGPLSKTVCNISPRMHQNFLKWRTPYTDIHHAGVSIESIPDYKWFIAKVFRKM